MIARLRQLDRRSDQGITLVEVLVAMMISAILLAVVGSMFINVARVTANANATTTKGSTAANIMDAVVKVIRTGANNAVASNVQPDPAIVSASAAALTLYSYVDTNPTTPAPTKVGYRFDSQNRLIEDRWTASVSQGFWVFTGSATSRTLGGPLVTSTTPLFTYLDATGAVLDPGSGTLTLAQRQAVASIRVTVTIANNLTTGSDPIILSNTVGMPNLKISRTDN